MLKHGIMSRDSIHNLPPPSKFYVEREGMGPKINESLSQVPFVVVFGPPGTGKSQFVKEFGHSCLKSSTYQLVWRIEARNIVDLENDYDGLAKLLEIDANKLDVRGKIAAVHARLNSDSRLRDWLLIFDDAKNENDFFDLIGLLPKRHSSQYQGHVLITSRSPNWSQIPLIVMDAFSDSEAMSFLNIALPSERPEDWEQLNIFTGRHPLALSQAAGYIRHRRGTSIQSYLTLIASATARFSRIGSTFSDGCAATIASIVQLSIDELSRLHPFAVVLLDHIVVLPSAPIRDDVIGMLVNTLKKPQYQHAMQACEDFGLLVSFVEQGKLVYQMHQLTIETRRAMLTTEQVQQRLLWWILVFLQAFDTSTVANPDLNTKQLSLLSHVKYSLEFLSQRIKAGSELNVLMALLHRVVVICTSRLAKPDFAISFCQNVIEPQLGQEGKGNLITAASYNDIGNTYYSKGDYDKSIEYHNKALRIRLATLGRNHPDTASSYSSIGHAYNCKGEYDKAFECFNAGLAIRLTALSENHADTGTSYNNIGVVYSNKGEYNESIKYHHKALTIRLATLGGCHLDTATSYSNIGNGYYNNKEYDKAIQYHKKARAIRQTILTDNHPDTASSYNDIGLSFYGEGEYGKALKIFKKSLAIRQTTLGENHPDTAFTFNNIGIVYNDKGEPDKAIEYHMKALAIQTTVHGKNHSDTATTCINIGNAHNNLGEHDKAIEYYKEALVAQSVVHGKNHSDKSPKL